MAYSRAHPGKHGLLIDWETSGSDFGGDSTLTYQGISFGAVIVELETFEPIDTLYCEIKFDDTKYKWSMEAEAVHGLTREYLADKMDREEALQALLELILKYVGAGNKIYFIGHNVDFDIAFTLQLCKDLGLENLPVHHVNTDTAGIAFTFLGIYKSNDLFDLYCGGRSKKHNALDDCFMTLAVLQGMRKTFLLGVDNE